MFATTASAESSAPLLATAAVRDGDACTSTAAPRSTDVTDGGAFGHDAGHLPRGGAPSTSTARTVRSVLVSAASLAVVARMGTSAALAWVGGGSIASTAAHPGSLNSSNTLGIPLESESQAHQHQVTVGFQSRGFYNYRASIRLLTQAFPNMDLVLVGDAGDALSLVDNVRVHRGHGGKPGDAGFPEFVDFVLEGPNVHRWVDGDKACAFIVGKNTGGWIQTVAEPSHVYDDHQWCPHDAPPAVRLDTSLAKFMERAYPESHTSYLWAPYATFHLLGEKYKFANREFTYGGVLGHASPSVGKQSEGVSTWSSPYDRPFLAAYLSSDCKQHREVFFNHLRTCAGNTAARNAQANSQKSRPGVGEVHGLGKCSHSPSIQSTEMSEYAPFHDYRFVETFESTEEVGYVTEKLGTALASGSVPIYWGDSEAASLVFNPKSFIDAKGVWRAHGMAAAADNLQNAGEREWASLAQHVVDVDANEQMYIGFLLADTRAEELSSAEAVVARGDDGDSIVSKLGERSSYPNPFPDARLDAVTEIDRRPRVKQAVTRLQNAFQVGRRRLDAAHEKGRLPHGSHADSVYRNSWRRDAENVENDRVEERRPNRLPFRAEALERRQ